MSNPFIPIVTAEIDWSRNLPISVQYDDIYHSITSGIQQSRHVFIDGNNLISRWQTLSQESPCRFTVAETGFGTGLNFLLTWQIWEEYAPQNATLHFISCEKHPLNIDDLKRSLSFWPELKSYAHQLIDQYPVLTPGYHHISFNNGRVILTLMLGEALDTFEQLLICGDSNLEKELRTCFIDAWYLDGFAPCKNQSMWSDSLIKIVALLSRENTTLATYTAANIVKATLKDCGFIVEKKKGFGPKRHMVTAYYKPSYHFQTKHRESPWHYSPTNKAKKKSALVIGAGLAGCLTAHSLAKRGWDITVIEELEKPGAWGSANEQAVLFPKLSAYKSPLTHLMLSAFLFAVQFYKDVLNKSQIGELKGSLLLAYNQKEAIAQQSLIEWLSHYPELGQLVESDDASLLAGLGIEKPGLFIPFSGWINSPALCRLLLEHERISLKTGITVESLFFNEENWVIHDKEAPVLILANGNKVNCFRETESLPVKSIRGQMTTIAVSHDSAKLKIPVCAEGHVLPTNNALHHFGATYELGCSHAEIKSQDDILNYEKLVNIAPESIWSKEIKGHWAGVRATTPDYLPLVGPVTRADEFVVLYSGLKTNSKRWIAKPAPYYRGLYVCAGFGSRGLTSIPLCAEWLASQINNEMSCLPRNMIQALSPARFLRKNIVRGIS